MNEILIVHGSHRPQLNEKRATGAALFIKNQAEIYSALPDEIIFSGGKTSGKDKPSEAEEMRKIFLKRMHEIFKKNHDVFIDPKGESIFIGRDVIDISLEEGSCDTSENAQNVMKIISGTQGKTKFILFSSLTHLPRITRVYRLSGAKELETSSLEGQYFKAGGKFRNRFWKNIFTPEFLVPVVLEIPKYILTGFKPFQILTRKLAKRRLEK